MKKKKKKKKNKKKKKKKKTLSCSETSQRHTVNTQEMTVV
jgi:hypothetical protein